MPIVATSEVKTLEGLVHEVQPAGHYTYLRVGGADAAGAWAVVFGEFDAEIGDALVLGVYGTTTDFHSRRLERDFDRLFFVRVLERA